MKYDFTTILDREGHDALAVDSLPIPDATVKDGFSKIPMWVADMNFPVLPAIQESIFSRLNEPHFGYFTIPDAYYDAIISWQKSQNNLLVKKEHIGYENGVLGGVSSVVQAYTAKKEPVLVHAPTYIGFTKTLKNLNRTIIHSDLIQDENGIWRMDYEDMDRKIKAHQIKVCIFCSPHNPTGRVWEKEEIEKAMEVYRNNQCIVISDEIWSDLILPGHQHIPTQSISRDARGRTVALYAPSKTFNLAGLVGSYHIIYNPIIKEEVLRVENASHYNSPNILSIYALLGAYSQEGKEWVKELCETIQSNIDYALNYIQSHFKGIKVARPQGTYMLYLDCTEYLEEQEISLDELLRKGIEVGVLWQDGRPFQKENTIRMNLALPLSKVKEAMQRLSDFVFTEENSL